MHPESLILMRTIKKGIIISILGMRKLSLRKAA